MVRAADHPPTPTAVIDAGGLTQLVSTLIEREYRTN